MKSVRLLLTLFVVLFVTDLFAQQNYIDTVTRRAMEAFEVPGIAVSVVKDGKVVHMRGYGVSSMRSGAKMDENTLFAIASNSKAFTGAALAILVEQGKLSWDTPVCDIIPEFRLYDPYITRFFTISDMLSHRGGLPLGAGDLMIWPDGSDFKVTDVIYNLRYLKASSSFRTKYNYNNLMYIVAGEVIARVSGKSWEQFVEDEIMTPLSMKNSAASFDRLKERTNVIDPHAHIGGILQPIEMTLNPMANAAGGIYSSVADMTKWILMQMESRRFENTWVPQIIIPVRGKTTYKTNFSTYALGWRVSDVEGYKMVTHTGGLSGVLTQVTMIPDMNLGIIVFTNQQTSEAFTSITNTILDKYLGISGIDRVRDNYLRYSESLARAEKVVKEVESSLTLVGSDTNADDSNKESLNQISGTYKDLWLGDVNILESGGKLRFVSVRSPKLSGNIYYYKANTFVVKWDDRSFDADAFMMFKLDSEGRAINFTMRAVSPLTDFSYDFHDLFFERVKP